MLIAILTVTVNSFPLTDVYSMYRIKSFTYFLNYYSKLLQEVDNTIIFFKKDIEPGNLDHLISYQATHECVAKYLTEPIFLPTSPRSKE